MEQLLEERERDLELAARIGQTLLEKNRQLIEQVTFFLNSLETNFFESDYQIIEHYFKVYVYQTQLRFGAPKRAHVFYYYEYSKKSNSVSCPFFGISTSCS